MAGTAEELDNIIERLTELKEAVSETASALGAYLGGRKDEIWTGGEAESFWELAAERKKAVEDSAARIDDLKRAVTLFRDETAESGKGAAEN